MMHLRYVNMSTIDDYMSRNGVIKKSVDTKSRPGGPILFSGAAFLLLRQLSISHNLSYRNPL